MDFIKPDRLKLGDTLGIFTPSMPCYTISEEVLQSSLTNLEKWGFNVKLGFLTEARASQGYRSGSPQDRANEFMELIQDPNVKGLMATIGGSNSSSMLPYLDFEAIRSSKKVISGYSDVTSLHMAILSKARLRTVYGAALMPSFFEDYDLAESSMSSFVNLVTQGSESYPKTLKPFPKWSNHFRDWATNAWKTEARDWQDTQGWRSLRGGQAEGQIVVANLNTMLCLAGTEYFPDLKDKILIIEEMAAPYSRLERNLAQLKVMGVFENIQGLIFGKIESENREGAPFSSDDLLLETVGGRKIPIVSEFDCAHTEPLMSLAQLTHVKLNVSENNRVVVDHLEDARV